MSRRISLAVVLASLAVFQSHGQQTEYPSGIGWVNVKSFGARGDSVSDDTEPIRRAITTYPRQYHTKIVVYFPDGVYTVRDSLAGLSGYWDCGLTLQGQSRERTRIRLADSSPGYADTSRPKPVFVTRAGNQAFAMYVFNLTISVGRNNPGAVAADYITSNTGAMKNVMLRSEDGRGYCGLRMERGWPGPGLVKDVTIDGFMYGIRMATPEYSMTFENIALRNQTVCGLVNNGNIAAMRRLTASTGVPVIRNNGGQVVLVEGTFTGSSSAVPAIVNSGFIYLRSVKASGYQRLMSGISGDSVGEYASQAPSTLFPTSGLMLSLPIKETPEYWNNDTTQWANAADFGARSSDPLYGAFDATVSIRNALHCGKPIVFFPPNGSNGSSYQMYDTVSVPSGVRLVTGMDAASITCNGTAALVVRQYSAEPLIVERISVGRIRNECGRTLVIRHGGLGRIEWGSVRGDLFLEDVVGKLTPRGPLNVWARQLNTEVQSESDTNVHNNGGMFWILGQKTEGRAPINWTVNGGYSEILGGLMYPASSFAANDNVTPAFRSVNGCISVIMAMSSYVERGLYPVWAEETRGGQTRVLRTADVGWRTGFYRGGCENPVAETGPRQGPGVVRLPHVHLRAGTLTAEATGATLTVRCVDLAGRAARWSRGADRTAVRLSDLACGGYVVEISADNGYEHTVRSVMVSRTRKPIGAQ